MYKSAGLILVFAVLGLNANEHLGYSVKTWSLNNYSPEFRIVGGVDSKEGEFPYQVSLQLRGLVNGHFCGGSILSDKVILTAAHCISGLDIPPLTNLEIVAGLHKVSYDGVNAQRRRVVKSVVHKSYVNGVGPYDIGLHILDKPLKLNEFVQPIALPEPGQEFTGDCVLSGWGSISNKSNTVLPDILQKATLPLVDYDKCEAKFGESPIDKLSNICTGPIGGQLSACMGDSGGPLVKEVGGKKVVIGIVSWGMVPCGHGYPSVYTKVSSFVDWIKQNSA